MQTAHTTRALVEAALAHKAPAALSPRLRTASVRTGTGIAAIDRILQGGIPSAAITELVGSHCSGRMSLALSYVAAATQMGHVCAWIDVCDALAPESASAFGVDLERLLWVRCHDGRSAANLPLKLDLQSSEATLASAEQVRHTGGGSPHPRSEGRDMPEAIQAMLQTHNGLHDNQARREKRMIGTPGAPNRPLTQRAEDREEQVNSDRRPPRRGANLSLAPRCAEPHVRRTPAQLRHGRLPLEPATTRYKSASGSCEAIDQGVRSADLLLQAGGFHAIVLDLGGVRPEAAWRIPMATWFRFRSACERARVSLLLLTQHSCARSGAELVVRLQTGSMTCDGRVMTGVRYAGEAERNRFRAGEEQVIPIRRPPQSETAGRWVSEAAWSQAK